jgi:methyltransferase (TIGR00027 family)
MRKHQASRTAEYMAFFRASESVRPKPQRLFTDPFAIHFLSSSLRRGIALSKIRTLARLVNRYADYRLPGARSSAIGRTRLIDDAIRASLPNNLSQLVILGAGYDCRAYRLPELADIPVFEVDHPNTRASKRAHLRNAGIEPTPNIRSVELDFNHQSLPGPLLPAGFQPQQPAIFLWEGVTNYLTAEAVDTVLRYIASCAPNTQLIFTYIDAAVLDTPAHFAGAARVLRDVTKIGEPWTFGLAPAKLATYLHQRGFALDSDLSAAEYRAKYFGPESAQMKGYEFYHVAVAHVSCHKTHQENLHA